MATRTKPGIELYYAIDPRSQTLTTCFEAQETLSLIARAAKTYARIQEIWCSVELTEKQRVYYTDKESRLEARIKELARALIHEETGLSLQVKFEGDPRGYVVRLVLPDGREVGVA